MAGSLTAQTLTEVINEFNTGVEKLNAQEYDAALGHFNQVLTLAETVGDEANDMKAQAEKQIPSTYYRQATTFMKRKQYDNAIPNLEILARIAKATARKFDCSLDIDFSEGNRHIEFIGDENNKNLIAAEIEHIFRAERKSE